MPDLFNESDAARIAGDIAARLNLNDLRAVLEAIEPRGRRKSAYRIVREAEEIGSSRGDRHGIARYLVDFAREDVLSIRKLRERLAYRASDEERRVLHDFSGAQSRARRDSKRAIAASIAKRSWHPGKPWARHFVRVFEWPPVLAGRPGLPLLPSYEEVEPYTRLDPLKPFQRSLKGQALEIFGEEPGANRAILTLPTGAGKTRTAVEALTDWFISARGEMFLLWIAQSEELCEQAVQAFKEVWRDRGGESRDIGRRSLHIYRLWGSRRDVFDEAVPGVIVATIDKLRSLLGGDSPDSPQEEGRDTGRAVMSDVGVVVIDEAHRAEAPSYRGVLASGLGIDFRGSSSSERPVLGLTATPHRSQDEETSRLARRFYNRLLRPEGFPDDPHEWIGTFREQGILSHAEHVILPHVGGEERLTEEQEEFFQQWNDVPPDVLDRLGQERDRNRQLRDAILELDEDWAILFFGCSVQQAQAMSVLVGRHRSTAVITSETRAVTRREYVERFRRGEIKVLCNYGVLTTGFDAPQVQAVVIGRPTTSRVLYAQMIGRGMRGPEFGGTERCLVIDAEYNLVHHDGSPVSVAANDYWNPTPPSSDG